MPKFENDRISFEVPPDWQDRSLISYSAPQQGTEMAPNVVMTLDHLKDPTTTLAHYADTQIAELAKQLDGINMMGRRELDIDGKKAIELHFSWVTGGAPVEQRLLMVKTGKTVTCMTATSKKGAAAPSTFERIFTSIRWKGLETEAT